MKQLIAFGKALADPTRVRILNALRRSDLCVCELEDALALKQSTLSSHLQILREAGIVVMEPFGTWRSYRIDPGIRDLVDLVFDRHLSNEAVLQQDLRRVNMRLKLRVGGHCVLGAGQLQPEEYHDVEL